jgi:beta-lactamase superfamily II metal-dependent hydrolase
MLAIEMLPARYGDCLWIEYGDPGRPRRILVDCGLRAGYDAVAARLRDRPEVVFDLFVMTHIDADHIQGGIHLLHEFGPDRLGEVWFNGHDHLPLPQDVLGVLQAERFTDLLLRKRFPWNRRWDGKAVMVPEDGPLPMVELPDGLKLTLLSPDRERLVALRKVWDEELERLEREPGMAQEEQPDLQPDTLGPAWTDVERLAETPYKPDRGEANGSSIALLAEHDGKAVLLAGDAFAPLLERTIGRLLRERRQERLRLDAFKVSHHGGRGNTSPGLLDLVRCERFLFSTDGTRYHHPHLETIARILKPRRDVSLHFNYRSDENDVWDDRDLQDNWRYEAHYPRTGAEGYKLVL